MKGALLTVVLVVIYLPQVLAINGVPSILANYDPANFLCAKFNTFCDQIMQDLGCIPGGASSTGCPGFPAVENDISHYVGTCECNNPYPISAGDAVAKQLLNNRIAPDLHWILEPWNTGPPYDYRSSYAIVCEKVLTRAGCPEYLQSISTNAGYVCSCGTFTAATQYVSDLIMNEVNKWNSATLPIFENPIHFSRPLSLAMIFIVGKIFAIVFTYFTLPAVLGYIMAGIALQNFLDPTLLLTGSREVKTLCLVIVIMRAGFSLRVRDFYANQLSTLVLSSVPFFGEFCVWMFLGVYYFDGWTLPETGLFASAMAPVGPSVIINQMLNILGQTKRNYGTVPKQMLMNAPLEAVLAIAMFGFFQAYNEKEDNSVSPWVKQQPLWLNSLLLPVNLVFSCFLGILLGWGNSLYIDWRSTFRPGGGGGAEFLWVRLKKNPQMGSHTADFVYVVLVSCFSMTALCQPQYIQFATGELVVFVNCITMVFVLRDRQKIQDIGGALRSCWVFAEVILCTLLGASLAFDQSNGPNISQRALSTPLMQKMGMLMFLGVIGRLVGIAVSVVCLLPWASPHRQSWQWIWRYVLNIWVYSLPRSTVQATLGTSAYFLRILPGKDGLNKGFIILQSAAFMVLIFGPLGAFMSKIVGFPLSAQLAAMDEEVGWVEVKSGKTPLRSRSDTVGLNDHNYRSRGRSRAGSTIAGRDSISSVDGKMRRGSGSGKFGAGDRSGSSSSVKLSSAQQDGVPRIRTVKSAGNVSFSPQVAGNNVTVDLPVRSTTPSPDGSPDPDMLSPEASHDHDFNPAEVTVDTLDGDYDEEDGDGEDERFEDAYDDYDTEDSEEEEDTDEYDRQSQFKADTTIFDTFRQIKQLDLSPLKDLISSIAPGSEEPKGEGEGSTRRRGFTVGIPHLPASFHLPHINLWSKSPKPAGAAGAAAAAPRRGSGGDTPKTSLAPAVAILSAVSPDGSEGGGTPRSSSQHQRRRSVSTAVTKKEILDEFRTLRTLSGSSASDATSPASAPRPGESVERTEAIAQVPASELEQSKKEVELHTVNSPTGKFRDSTSGDAAERKL